MNIVPYTCPVCQGKQTVPDGFYDELPGTGRVVCRSCNGTGILWGGKEKGVDRVYFTEIKDWLFDYSGTIPLIRSGNALDALNSPARRSGD